MKNTHPTKKLRRYHYKVYFPRNIREMVLEFTSQFRKKYKSRDPEPTYHAAEQMIDDIKAQKYNTTVPLPTFKELFNSNNKIVELYEILNKNGKSTGRIQKILIRVRNLHPNLDFTYVVAREGCIVSTWANEKGDEHRLKESKEEYYRPKWMIEKNTTEAV